MSQISNSKKSTSSSLKDAESESGSCKSASQADTAQSARLKSLLKKYLADDRRMANRVEQYHQKEFIERIDTIVQDWMVRCIFELRDFGKKVLSTKAENDMLSGIAAQLDKHFVVPKTDAEIDKLKKLYRELEVKPDKPGAMPQFYRKAFYLPNGMFPENDIMIHIYDSLRPKLIEALHQLWRLLYAIYLLDPNIDHSNNTGVLVQKKINRQIRNMKDNINGFLMDQGWLHYAQLRCHHLSMVAMTPQSVDARLAYLAFEKSNFHFVRNSVRDIANDLLMLQHFFMQHIDMVKKPRQEHASFLAAKIVN